jgi:hypothetical protein
MLIIALGLDLGLFWLAVGTNAVSTGFRSISVSISVNGSCDFAVETFLLFFLGDGVAGLLVGELCGSRVVTPAVSSLLVVLAEKNWLACEVVEDCDDFTLCQFCCGDRHGLYRLDLQHHALHGHRVHGHGSHQTRCLGEGLRGSGSCRGTLEH